MPCPQMSAFVRSCPLECPLLTAFVRFCPLGERILAGLEGVTISAAGQKRTKADTSGHPGRNGAGGGPGSGHNPATPRQTLGRTEPDGGRQVRTSILGPRDYSRRILPPGLVPSRCLRADADPGPVGSSWPGPASESGSGRRQACDRPWVFLGPPSQLASQHPCPGA